ncbi:hypothetical protein [uncultured Litoreibacter sp.]|uniref:phage integrase central domain-containing protein n=2 Tax=uncultured Litoreibacter sp. TaxID=1392394 RepID=UPI0026206228|nr:hypothetical protein [uncultured Litoreibacter sp.]
MFPTLGSMQVTKIATADVVGALKPIRSQKPETAKRVRQRIEAVLAHGIKDKAEAAYARSDLFDKRRELMQAWANKAEVKPQAHNVISLK